MKNYLKHLQLDQPNSSLTTYEINQQIYAQQNLLDADSLSAEVVNITQWFSKEPNFKYFMFLCRENNDYTIFNFKTRKLDQARDELQALILSRGTPIAVEYEHDSDAYEIWIKQEDEIHMFMLFACDDFVIEI